MELAGIIQVTLGLISAVSMGYAAWQRFRARQNQDGWALTDQSLRAVVAAIELLPAGDPRVQQAKRIIRSVSDSIGTERENLAKIVIEVRDLMDRAGFLAARDETDPASIKKAAKLITGGTS